MKMFIRLVVASLSLMLLHGVAYAEIGEEEFKTNCAACHGVDGKGSGAFLDFMRQAPADLTLISKRNGGKFPFKKIYTIIVDPEGTRGHGNSEMPVWGSRFSKEVIEQYGPYDTIHQGVVENRVLRLVFYLSTIQQ
jgi:mono/diheme cytochrome c family protein